MATRSRWAMVAFVTLLAFLCQSFLTQTHLHTELGSRPVALAQPLDAAATVKSGQSSPDVPDCPICREISHGGTYLPSVPVAIATTMAVTLWRVVLPSRTLAPSQVSHAWRSRAPPLSLHA